MDTTDTITVDVSIQQKIQANRADLIVEIRGDSLITGRAALKKAREVHQLVNSLAALGIGEDQIHIDSIRASVSSGLLSKSSSAIFQLRILCDDLSLLADIIGAITAQKQADLSHIEWGFPDRHILSMQLLSKAVPQALEKARHIADLLGVELLGVHSLHETCSPPPPEQPGESALFSTHDFSRQQTLTQEDLGLEISHAKEVTLSLHASFRVSPLK